MMRFIRILFAPLNTAGLVLLCVAMTGCAEVIHRVPETVQVPVAVPCLKASEVPNPKEPFLTDAELFALDRYQRTFRLWDERREYQSYTGKLNAVLKACIGGG